MRLTTVRAQVDGAQLANGERRKLTEGCVVTFGGPKWVLRDSAPQMNPYYYTVVGLAKRRRTALIGTARTLDLTCGLCYDPLVHVHVLACGHHACGECIWKWTAERVHGGARRCTCPFCRAESPSGPVACPLLDQLLEEVVEPSLAPEERRLRGTKRARFETYRKEDHKYKIAKERLRAQVPPLGASPLLGSPLDLASFEEAIRRLRN